MDIDKDSYTKLIILIIQFLDEENYKESLHLYGDVLLFLCMFLGFGNFGSTSLAFGIIIKKLH